MRTWFNAMVRSGVTAFVGLALTVMPSAAQAPGYKAARTADGKPDFNGFKMEWINPHAWIHLDVKRPDGQVEKWMIETGGPGALIRMGWTKKSIPPGTEVVIFGYRAKDGSLKANGHDVNLPDGRKLFLAAPAGAPPLPQ